MNFNIKNYLKLKLKKFSLKKKKVFIGDNTNFKGCSFEGRNLIGSNCDLYKSFIGIGTYIGDNGRLPKASIGKFSSIGKNLYVVLGIHPLQYVSTHHFAYSNILKSVGLSFSQSIKSTTVKYTSDNFTVKIGHDVWIGDNVSILSGITIGHGAVLATGAVITKDVPPYAIVAGVPGKILRYRFSQEEIDFLLNFQWWNKDLNWIEENVSLFSDMNLFYNKFNPKIS